MLVNSLAGWDNEIDIQKTIQLVRAQRSGMVQTEVRTMFTHTIIAQCCYLFEFVATIQVCVSGYSGTCGSPAGTLECGELVHLLNSVTV